MAQTGSEYDAVVVGSGPNGLTAGIVLARAGLSVLLLEAKETIGGGCRTAELTLPGFHHDICSAIHPMGILSPIFQKLDLQQYGLEWAQSEVPVAHPLDNGQVAVLRKSVHETASALGGDGGKWRNMVEPFLSETHDFLISMLQPLRFPRYPIKAARFGLMALRSCEGLVNSKFKGDPARALFAGCAAHSILSLDTPGTASFGLMLGLTGHAVGWPCAKGGSIEIIRAMSKSFQAAGGEIRTGMPISRLEEIPSSRAVMFDLSPRQVSQICGGSLPDSYQAKLKKFVHGPGVFKVDWALNGPIPWKNPDCLKAATVHVGGTFEEICRSEHAAAHAGISDQPFVLVAQQSMFDKTRAPLGKHTGWGYCHVPNGSTVDMTARIENQIERFAPGFKDCILARHTRNSAELEAYNPTMIGGDVGGGRNDLWQFLFRPVFRWNPYSTPNPRLYLCSSSTPPGGGVHGMCGYWGARTALKQTFGLSETRLNEIFA